MDHLASPSEVQSTIEGKTGYSFTNWAKTFSCKPELYFCPENEDELIKILHKATQLDKKIKVVGCGNSPSDIACTEDYMVNMTKMNKLLKVDKEKSIITVQAGVTIKDLCENYLPQHELALSTAGSYSNISLGGAVSTGTHGSGINYGNISSYVLELDILLPSGEKIHCSRTENEEIFLSACCGIGAVGIMLNITIKCEPAFRLEQHTYPAPLSEVMAKLPDHLAASDHFRFLWYPHTDQVVISHVNRTEKNELEKKDLRGHQESETTRWHIDDDEQKIRFWIEIYMMASKAMSWLQPLSLTFWPHVLVPIINRTFFNLIFSQKQHIIDDGFRVFSFECLFKQYVNEWAVPIDRCAMVLQRLGEWLEKYPKAYAHLPVEVRFVKGDDLYISPAFNQTMCYINIIMYRPYGMLVPFRDYWNAYENIMRTEGGRPHWAKAHQETSKNFRSMYPQWKKWCEIQKKSDPRGRFLNSYLERILNNGGR
ncbi:L-gulonolactone oxidase [Nymphon striatum]|nr:L-gulonolactone oxidase [Nymphon striatum]